jgi:hypothetical protein
VGNQLASTVYITDPETGEVSRVPAGTKHTAKLGKAITNPSAWVEADEDVRTVAADDADAAKAGGGETPKKGKAAKKATAAAQESKGGDGSGNGSSDGGNTVEAPPRGGQGSGLEEWTEFAKSQNVEVPENTNRDELIVFLEQRGIIEPEQA